MHYINLRFTFTFPNFSANEAKVNNGQWTYFQCLTKSTTNNSDT